MKNIFAAKRIISLLCFPAVALISTPLVASHYTAIANGAWSNAATWSIGRAPSDNDTLMVPSGFTVTVDINSPSYANMVIFVAGTINFDNGQKINMCPGSLSVFDGGQLTGGTPGSKINICGSTVWNGPDATPGPIDFGTSQTAVVNHLMARATADGQIGSTARIIQVSWTITVEDANTSYEVERSTNGLSFETIGKVDGKGASSVAQQYSFSDEDPQTGTNYYQVKVVREGKDPVESEKSVAATISEEQKGCVLNVYPNPCVGECQVRFSDCPSDNQGVIVVEMVDANGATVSSTTPERDSNGGFTMQIDATNNLAPGMYIVRGTSAKKSYTQKAILK